MTRLETASLDAIVDNVRNVVDAVLAAPPATKLDLKRRLASDLGIDPDPETLYAFARVGEIEDPGGHGLVASAIQVRLAAQLTLHAIWGSPDIDPDALRHGESCLPAIEDLVRDEDRRFTASIDAVNRIERETVRRLRDPLRVDQEPLRAARVLAPEMVRLASACREGRLADVAPGIPSDEADQLTAVVRNAEPRPERVVADAVVMRHRIAELLSEWCDARATATEEPGTSSDPAVLVERLEAARAACRFVSSRLDATRSARFASSHAPDAALDEARRRLFAAYLDLNKILTGSGDDESADVSAKILEAEKVGAAIDARREETRALMRDAASTDESRVEAVLPPDAQDLARERRRKKILIVVALALVPVAVITNLLLHPWGQHRSGFEGAQYEAAMPLREVAPLPDRVYTEVSGSLWSTLSETERRTKAGELGAIAEKQGFRALVIVDEERRELALWSAKRGAELVVPDPARAP